MGQGDGGIRVIDEWTYYESPRVQETYRWVTEKFSDRKQWTLYLGSKKLGFVRREKHQDFRAWQVIDGKKADWSSPRYARKGPAKKWLEVLVRLDS